MGSLHCVYVPVTVTDFQSFKLVNPVHVDVITGCHSCRI